MEWIEIAGYCASALVFMTFCMKTMVPLRVTAIASNFVFIIYGFFGELYPVLILHLVLLPMNVWRTVEMLRLVKRVETAAKGDLSVDWLKPFMKSTRYKAGDVLFRRDDAADRIYLLLSGTIMLKEIAVPLHPGAVFGEIGLFSSRHARTQTAQCETDVELLWITERELAQICYQNPAIAFHLLRLITNRLLANSERRGSDQREMLPSPA
jgi:hypothetical protein